MKPSLTERAASLGLAVVVTLALLGGIDRIAQPQAGGGLWALRGAVTATVA